MIMSDKVKALNQRIEKLNVERTKIETQREILEKQLMDGIAEYKAKFGVDLNSDPKNIIKAIKAEKDKVEALIEEEFKLKESIVAAIESGNIAEANRLLGVKGNSEAQETINMGDGIDDEDEAIPATVAKSEAVEDDEDEDDEGDVVSPAEFMRSVQAQKAKVTVPDFDDDLDDIVDDVVDDAPVDTKSSSKVVLNEDEFVFDDEDEIVADREPNKAVKSNSDLVLDDDDDDFGFGDMLEGTKFEI